MLNKKLPSHWDESLHSRGTTRIAGKKKRPTYSALTGISAASYCFSDAEPTPIGVTGELGHMDFCKSAGLSPLHPALWQMA